MPNAIVLQPPPGNLTGPSAGPAYLKGYAREQGFDVWTWDLGIDAFSYFSQPQVILQLLNLANHLLQRLESKGILEPLEQRWYGLLLMARGFALDPDRLSEAVAGLRDGVRFYDYARYKMDCKVLDAFFRVLRAVFYPTMVTPWDYPSVHALKTTEGIRLHLEDDINPYLAYYRDVLIPRIAETKPDVVGISMVYASQSVQALTLGMLLKAQLPDIHITMGGSYLTQWAMLMDEAQLTFLFGAADSVVLGEGEIPFVHLLDCHQRGANLDDVPNLIFREGSGRIRISESLVFTDLSEQAPPDFSDVDLGAYLVPEPVLPYMPTRGCYWQRCGFCQNLVGKYEPRPYQTVPVEKAIAELTELAQLHSCRNFHFCVDVIDVDYLRSFSSSLMETHTSIFWHTNLRVEKELSSDLCDQLAGAGLKSVAIGMESGCQKTLDNMDKGMDIPTLRQVLTQFYDAGVATQVTGMFGFPSESEDQAQETVDFLMENVDSISAFDVGLLLVLPGSRMHDEPSNFGVKVIDYKQTSLMTPEPLWKAARRIPLGAVERLFERLGRLEAATWLSNDHPYLGAICSNHSFLYFMHGPGILKRLRAMEAFEHQEVHRIFGMNRQHRKVAEIEPKILRFHFPYMVYRSPYQHERAHFGTAASKHQRSTASGPGWDYLLDPINIPQQISPNAQQMLSRIDGQTDLRSIFDDSPVALGREEILFLARLLMTGLVTLADNTE